MQPYRSFVVSFLSDSSHAKADLMILEQFFCQFDDDAPCKLDVFWLRAKGTDKPYEIETFPLCRHQVDSPVVIDLTQQLLVQLVAALSTTRLLVKTIQTGLAR